jgi:2-oxoglutarate dehydrogenase E2 component (dihydrolipoamide succinyltransferase)
MGEQLAKVGDTVQVGAAIARVEAGVDAPSAAAAPSPAVAHAPGAPYEAAPAASSPTPGAPAAAAPDPAGGGDLSLSPAARRVIEERGLDPAAITGTGKDGRITKADAMAVQATAPVAPTAPLVAPQPVAPAAAGERRTERVRMTRLRQTIARRLKEAQDTAAMLTTFNDVDMSAVMAARDKYKEAFEKKHGVRLGFMSFFTRAACFALNEVPAVNARIDGEEIVYHAYADIGVAVSSPGGLVVPVLRDAQALSFAETETRIADFGKRARDGRLKLEELQGGTFTISNGGVFGSLMSTPILNPPQSGVLGLHRIEERPVARGGQVVIRPMMYLALSYDHRIVDGREAVTFLVRVKEAIEDPLRLLVDM